MQENQEIPIPEVQIPADASKRYTLAKRSPERFGKVLAMLAAGETYRAITRATGCDHRTIARVATENHESVDAWRKAAATQMQTAGHMALERLAEQLAERDDISAKDLAIITGILTDKGLVLSDQPTSITETRTGLSMDQAQQAIEAARKRISAEVIDV